MKERLGRVIGHMQSDGSREATECGRVSGHGDGGSGEDENQQKHILFENIIRELNTLYVNYE